MDKKVVMFMRETESPELMKELGEDFDFESNGIMLRILRDDDFDEYIESVVKWETEGVAEVLFDEPEEGRDGE